MRQHGTPGGYFNGCRCDDCKRAGALYRTQGNYEAYLAGYTRKPPLFHPDDRHTAFDPLDPRHGGISAYSMGCRCPLCCEAGAMYRKARKDGVKLPKGWNVRDYA